MTLSDMLHARMLALLIGTLLLLPVQQLQPHQSKEQNVTFQGFLAFKEWIKMQSTLTRFCLVDRFSGLDQEPSEWRITTRKWIQDSILCRRFRESIDSDSFEESMFSSDESRYIALEFKSAGRFLVDLLNIEDGAVGNLSFADGTVNVSDDLRLVIQEAYGIQKFTTSLN